MQVLSLVFVISKSVIMNVNKLNNMLANKQSKDFDEIIWKQYQ